MRTIKELKRELEELIEGRDAVDGGEVFNEERDNYDFAIEDMYREIANILLNDEEIMKKVQDILDSRKTTWVMVEMLDDKKRIDCVWYGDEVQPGDTVLTDCFWSEAKVLEIYEAEDKEDAHKAYSIEE